MNTKYFICAYQLQCNVVFIGKFTPIQRHAICHGCTDIIRVIFLIFLGKFCSEHTVFFQK